MNEHRPALAAYVLAAIVAVCITVLAALGVDVPEVLGYALAGALGGGAGASLPARAKGGKA